jgi:hypothetical protein
LKAEGAERPLPARWLGYNTPANYDIPVEDPAFRTEVKKLAPHFLRFPGGTVANYYQPESGQLDFGDHPDGSVYRKYLQSDAGPRSRRLHPNGVTVEQYIDFAREIDAELIVVPNLETSTVSSQVNWFKRMKAKGFDPRLLEMGNEFYLALLMDPVTMKIFPDYATTMRITKEYVDALRPLASKDSLVAVQAASENFRIPYTDAEHARHERETRWNNDLRPEPWFDAVTTHLYPTLEGSGGPGSIASLPGGVGKVYPAFMARTDEGFTRSITATAARMPGKEIWVTEWGAFEPSSTLGGVPVQFDGMWLHMIVRGLFAQLRHREVTISTPHALFANGNLMSAFRRANAPDAGARPAELGGNGGATGGYVPINFAGVVAWFGEAMRGPDAHYTRLAAEGSRRIAAETTYPGEGFRDVEAGLFRVGRRHTLLVQNAWDTPQRIDLAAVLGSGGDVRIDLIETPKLLESLQRQTPAPREIPASPQIDAPPYSLVRVRWSA